MAKSPAPDDSETQFLARIHGFLDNKGAPPGCQRVLLEGKEGTRDYWSVLLPAEILSRAGIQELIQTQAYLRFTLYSYTGPYQVTSISEEPAPHAPGGQLEVPAEAAPA